MESPNQPEDRPHSQQSAASPFIMVWAFVFTLLWSFLIATSLFWNIHNIQNQMLALATGEAKTTWNKDQAKGSIESVELTHSIIWILGCGGIFIFSLYARRHNNEMALQQQRLEVLVQQRTQELIEKEQRLSKIMDTAVDAIVTANDKGIIESFNRASERMFGYKSEEIIGKSINILMTQTDSGQHDSHLDHYQKTGQARIIGVGREVMARDIHGREFLIELSVSEMRSGGKVIFTSFMHDISQRKAHEQALFSAKEAAENANQAKSEFLSSMSHELRTPLNAILGFSQMLTLDPDQPLTEDQALAVEHIQAGGEHLLALIDQVLDLAKIEAGKMDVSLESLNTQDVLDECLNMIEAQASMRSISLVKDYQLPVSTLIQADYTRLKQVMLNLLSNAVKYNKEGGSITLIAYEFNEKSVHIEVRDTGPGIPLDKQAGLFEPFNRLGANSSEVSGTGIGLTISKKLIESMQGRIGFSSRPGLGSSFWIELPLGNRNNGSGQSQCTSLPAELPALQGTILYVEDNPANLSLIESILSKLPDIKLFTSTNAEDGLVKAVEESPGLIIMDINLPGMDGVEAMELLKDIEETNHIPVVALSASATPADIEKGLAAGFNDYLTKPIQLPKVLALLEKYLKKDRLDS